jgi:hypothetical protein
MSNSKLDPQRLIFGVYLVILIVAAELAFNHLALPAWPAFMVMIFFFMEHMNPKKIPHILIGGLCGIACILGAKFFITALAPSLGVEGATLLFIVIVVYAIVAFGEIVPQVFNNYAFMYLTVSGIAAKLPDPNPLQWMAVELVGGVALLAGVGGIGKLMAARAPRAETAGAPGEAHS